ncbi:primosomal protein, partial [bacterium]|nr:primosomal protein [bacterium]
MKLIKEVHDAVEYLTEEKDGNKQLFIQGPFLVAERKNKNGRLYEFNTMKKEVSRYTEEYVN